MILIVGLHLGDFFFVAFVLLCNYFFVMLYKLAKSSSIFCSLLRHKKPVEGSWKEMMKTSETGKRCTTIEQINSAIFIFPLHFLVLSDLIVILNKCFQFMCFQEWNSMEFGTLECMQEILMHKYNCRKIMF